MHQHVFKVGWLLSRNSKTTVIFYYTAFLPGVILHELIAWLTAGICNVRATRAVQLPQQEQIDTLNLGFVRIANGVHPFKRMLIELVPLLVALLVLWHIAIDVLNLSGTWTIAASGSLDDLSRAISNMTATADFWLWFYLAFTIANTMMPALPSALQRRKRLSLAIGAMLLVTIVLGIGEFRNSEITATAESLLSSLTIVLLVIMCTNLVMVLVLGSLEAIIERVSGHSATFVDGKLRTLTRQEARRQRQGQSRRLERQPAPLSPIPLPKSIYALPLPIPGPPGIEPVSRNIAAVLDLRSSKDGWRASRSDSGAIRDEPDVIRDMSTPSKLDVTEQSTRTILPSQMLGSTANRAHQKETESNQSADSPGASNRVLDSGQWSDERAPFNRPFVGAGFEGVDDDESIALNQPETGFARPFSAPNDSDTPTESSTVAFAVDQASSAKSIDAAKHKTRPVSVARARSTAKTKPVPKPSQKPNTNGGTESGPAEADEPRYEPLADDEIYDYDGAADDSS